MVNAVFFTLFFSVVYYLLHRWRDKIRCSTGGATRSETPLHLVSLPEIAAIVSLMASFIYLLGFFGIDFVQSFISHASHDAWDLDNHHNFLINDVQDPRHMPPQQPQPAPESLISTLSTKEDEEIVKSVLIDKIASHSLESQLSDCKQAASIQREALQRTTGFGGDGSGSGGAGDSGLVLVDMG